MLDDFLSLSETLTGFDAFALRGTGQAQAYLDTLTRMVGSEIATDLTSAHASARDRAGDDAAAFSSAMRANILSDPRLGPVARNLIKMWYVGTWYEMPRAWRDTYGTAEGSESFVVSPQAYTEGLLWPAVGANPSGAKPFGYGMWAMPPRVKPT